MSTFTPDDHHYMALALRLAERGLYTTTPNPRVGCVIVKDRQVIASGAHLQAGQSHAEAHALLQLEQRIPDPQQRASLLKGAAAYVTLEPCSHTGRTPPCADALVRAGVSRVIAAMQDPNPLVAGQGLARLSAHGISVDHGLMAPQAAALNAGFIKRMTDGMPYVRTKIAASLDGKTALQNGVSQWITGSAARQDVQRWRARSCAILTGIGTVLADNASMSVRLSFEDLHGTLAEDGLTVAPPTSVRQPLKVLVDSALRISPDAALLQGGPVLIAYANAPQENIALLAAKGVELEALPDAAGQVDLQRLLRMLAVCGINEVMVEAGSHLNGALLQQGLVDECVVYYAPLVLGHAAMGMFDMPALQTMAERTQFHLQDVRQIGQDIRIILKPQAS